MTNRRVITDVQRNVKYCLMHFRQFSEERKVIAGIIRANPSTIGRWLKLSNNPGQAYVARLADLCHLPQALFYGPHKKFIQEVIKLDAASDLINDYTKIEPRILLGALEKWKHHSDECFERHVGSYFMYCRALSDPGRVAISLLRITEKTDRGIAFDIHNVDTRVVPGGKPIVYRYKGLMFPVYECLMFYGEEQGGDEPFSMVTSSAQVPGRSILAGYFVAVAVKSPVRMPTGTKAALFFREKKILEPERQLAKLGVFDASKIPSQVLELIL